MSPIRAASTTLSRWSRVLTSLCGVGVGQSSGLPPAPRGRLDPGMAVAAGAVQARGPDVEDNGHPGAGALCHHLRFRRPPRCAPRRGAPPGCAAGAGRFWAESTPPRRSRAGGTGCRVGALQAEYECTQGAQFGIQCLRAFAGEGDPTCGGAGLGSPGGRTGSAAGIGRTAVGTRGPGGSPRELTDTHGARTHTGAPRRTQRTDTHGSSRALTAVAAVVRSPGQGSACALPVAAAGRGRRR